MKDNNTSTDDPIFDDYQLLRDIDHGQGKITKGCKYSTVEVMLRFRLSTIQKLQNRIDKLIAEREHDPTNK